MSERDQLMLLRVRFFSEITIKTRPVRRRFIDILRSNLLILLRRIDALRHPDEQESQPLHLNTAARPSRVVTIPFYHLHKILPSLDQNGVYLLYCQKGMMSRLHGSPQRCRA